MRPTHAEIKELLGAYALDALEDPEREAVEAHLSGCPQCRAEVAEHRETAAMLANVGGVAPTGVWDRIEAALEPAGPKPAVVVPPRRPVARAAAALLAAAAMALVGLLGLKVADLDRRLDRMGEGLEAVAAAALVDPDATRLVLRSRDGRVAVDAVVLPDGTAYLLSDNLRALSAGRTYQLWAMTDGTAVSVGVLGPDPGIVPFRVVSAIEALAITAEAVPGAEHPSGVPVVSGDVPTS